MRKNEIALGTARLMLLGLHTSLQAQPATCKVTVENQLDYSVSVTSTLEIPGEKPKVWRTGSISSGKRTKDSNHFVGTREFKVYRNGTFVTKESFDLAANGNYLILIRTEDGEVVLKMGVGQ